MVNLSSAHALVAIELQLLSNEYWARVDGTSSGSGAELFTADGELRLGPVSATGQAEIAVMLARRSAAAAAADRSTRHIMTNHRLISFEADRASHRFTVQVLAVVGSLPQPATPPTTIGDFEESFVRDSSGKWQIERSTAIAPFAGNAAPAFAQASA